MANIVFWGRVAACLLPVTLVLTVLGFGAIWPGYSQWEHPVAMLGASGLSYGRAFSLLAFVLPGLLAVVAALSVVSACSGRLQRIGLQLTLLSGVAFCGLGLLPLDLLDLESRASQYHASAWLLWVVAFVPGSGVLGLGLLQRRHGRALGAVCLIAALLVALLSFFPSSPWLPPALVQRLAFLTWAIWWPLAVWLLPNRLKV